MRCRMVPQLHVSKLEIFKKRNMTSHSTSSSATAATLERQTRQLVTCLNGLLQRVLPLRSLVDSESQLTAQECGGLAALGFRGCLTISDFASALGIPVSTASYTADKLVRKGLVLRTRSDEDRRVVQVELSEAGKKLEQIFFERRLKMGHEMLALLNARAFFLS
jgi:DNA-binding MarR family transcriptional regulator